MVLSLDHGLEILRGRVFLGAEFDVGRVRGQGVARGVRGRTDRLELLLRSDLHVDLELPQGMLLKQVALQRVLVAVAVAAERQHLRVGDCNPLFGIAGDGEDAGLDVRVLPFRMNLKFQHLVI